jgi:pilus assembly protein CpaB
VKLPRQWIVFGTGALFAVLAGAGAHRYIGERIAAIEARQPKVDMVKLVVANDDMPRGAHLNADTVSVRSVPREWAHADALAPDQVDQFDNAELDTPARRGEQILWAQLQPLHPRAFSNRISPGRRAITVPVDDVSSVSGMVAPGDRIDLLATIKRDGRATLIPLLQKATVLATGKLVGDRRSNARGESRADDDNERRTYTTLTIDASPKDAARILAAREIGQLTAVLRSPADEADIPMRRADALSILESRENSAPARVRLVSVIYGEQLAHAAAMRAGLVP